MSDKNTPGALQFGKKNYMWMAIGGVVMVIALLLMVGGKSDDPNVFNYNEVYSKTRITVAPILFLTGLIIEMYAIMLKPQSGQTSN